MRALPSSSDLDSAAPAKSHRCGRRVTAAVAACSALIALVGGAALASRRSRSSNLSSTEKAYEAANERGRIVEQHMASSALPGLDMEVRMIGGQLSHGYIVGHLATVRNPQGRVSLVLPAGGCGTREKTSVTGQGCRLAVNAGYFNEKTAACIGNVVVDGSVVQTVPLEESNVNFGMGRSRMAVGYFTPEEVRGFEQVVSGVTWLVRDNESYVKDGWRESNITVQSSGEKYKTSASGRTALGWNAKGEMVVMQVDGSTRYKRGANMREMAELLLHYGVINAINLDGGGSTAMVKDGELINYPSDDYPPDCEKSRDFLCERPVSSILCVREAQSVPPLQV